LGKKARRLGPVAPPATLGLKPAARGRPEKMMLTRAMPRRAAPRRTSSEERRSEGATGASGKGESAAMGTFGDGLGWKSDVGGVAFAMRRGEERR